ncbi:MAG: hypothetical protein HKN46_03175 [Acidimicrobiia bacterium]|nr:hypothetical protein [Acidimicrobiia bacterium]
MSFSRDLLFDPAAGTVIRRPSGSGYGHWAGGHKVSFDPESGLHVLFYRVRTPLEAGRGGVCRVAVSDDGIRFDDVWEAHKQDLAAESIEVGHCVRHDEDEWRLYLSYERAGQPGYWRIDVLRGTEPGTLDTQGRRTVLEPGMFGKTFIKDPWVRRRGDDGYDLYATTNPRDGALVDGTLVRTAANEETVLAESHDGLSFPTIDHVFAPAGDGSWHGQRSRLNSLVDMDDVLVGTYDGSRTFYDNYEEACGLVTSPDGRTFTRVPTDGPWVTSAYGAVRYVYGLRVGDRLFWYYEYTVEDGSHELRVAIVDL